MAAQEQNQTRHDWTREEVLALFNQPFNDLLFDAQVVHRRHFNPNSVQLSTLLSIKTGACLKTANTAPRAQGTIPAWKKRSCWRWKRSLKRPKWPRPADPADSVWVLPGARPMIGISPRLPI